MTKTKALVLVLHGPAGVGKDSLINRLRERTTVHRATSSTTRRPRKGEQDGVDYHFLNWETFGRGIDAGEFVEFACVYGDLKGMHTSEIVKPLDAGLDLIIRTDVQGARTWRKKIEGAVYIFLMPGGPSWTGGSLIPVEAQGLRQLGAEIEDIRRVLHARLTDRQSESTESMERRLAEIDEELRDIPNNDYVVVNRDGNLDDAVDAVQQIIERERGNPARPTPRLLT